MPEEELEYENKMLGSYMLRILPGENGSYELAMLSEAVIPYLLPLRLRRDSGQDILEYDISALENIKERFVSRPVTFDELSCLVFSIEGLLRETDEHFLSEDELYIRPETVFMEKGRRNVFFMLVPDRREDFRNQLRELFEWIFKNIDYTDDRAVLMGYSLLRICEKEYFSVKELIYEAERRNGLREENSEELLHDDSESPYFQGNVNRTSDGVLYLLNPDSRQKNESDINKLSGNPKQTAGFQNCGDFGENEEIRKKREDIRKKPEEKGTGKYIFKRLVNLFKKHSNDTESYYYDETNPKYEDEINSDYEYEINPDYEYEINSNCDETNPDYETDSGVLEEIELKEKKKVFRREIAAAIFLMIIFPVMICLFKGTDFLLKSIPVIVVFEAGLLLIIIFACLMEKDL